MLRVSMVRMELCSTRTIGRSARRGMLDVCVRTVVVGDWRCEGGRAGGQGAIASMERWWVAEQRECRRDYRTCGDMDGLWGRCTDSVAVVQESVGAGRAAV